MQRRAYIIIVVFFFTCFEIRYICAQDLEKVGRDNPLSISGGFSTDHVMYFSDGINNRRDPYNFFFTGNLNIDLYGLSIPLSFSYSNQQFSYRQPFNQIGISPTYKWATGHFGYRNLNYSKYTLNGHIFLGGGLELEPNDRWKVEVMYGRFNRAIEPNEEGALPFYRRMGAGIKTSYRVNNTELMIIGFGAWDDPTSLSIIPDSLGVTPEENMVLSVGLKQTLVENLSLEVEAARSSYTRDLRAPELDGLRSTVDHLFIPTRRTNTTYYNAMNARLGYDLSFMNIGVRYERIDPEYRTLGAYFFNNDLENITLDASTQLFESALSINGHFGFQRDNLADQKATGMERMVGSLNVAWIASDKLNLNASYSNFQSFVNVIPVEQQLTQATPYDNFDTLNYVQIAQNAMINGSYRIKSTKKASSMVNLNGSFQQTDDQQGGVAALGPSSRMYNVNGMYNHSLSQQNITFGAGLNTNITETMGASNNLYGISASIGKAFFEKKLKTQASVNVNRTYFEDQLTGSILNCRMNGNYVVAEKHRINVHLTYINRVRMQQQGAERLGEYYAFSFNELTVRGGYSYRF